MTRMFTLLCALFASSVCFGQLGEAEPTIAEVAPASKSVPLPIDPQVIDQSLALEPESAGSLAPSSEIEKKIDETKTQIFELMKAKAYDTLALEEAEKEESALLMTRNVLSSLEESKKIPFLSKLHSKWKLGDDDDVVAELDKRITAATTHRTNLAAAVACSKTTYEVRKATVSKLEANLAIATERERKEAAYALPDEFAAFKRQVEGRLTSVEKKANDTAATVSEIQKELVRQSEMVMLLAAMKLSYDEQAAKDELLAKARDYLARHKGDPKAAKKVTETLEKAVTIFTKSKQTPQRSFTITPSHAMPAFPQPQCQGNTCNAPTVKLPTKSSGRGRRKG